MNKTHARDAIQAIKVFEMLDLSRIPDGQYEGTASGFRGPLQVRVTVKAGKIIDVKVIRHKEDRFYTSLTEVPRQIVETQGLKGVDAVTGATVTSNAIINATAQALGRAMK